MIDQFQDTNQTSPQPKNNFPIVMQLGVVALLGSAVIGTLLFYNHTSTVRITSETPPESIQPDPRQTATVPQKIDQEAVTVGAYAAYVWDVRTQRALYNKHADEQLPLASITKLMTTLLAHELVDDTKKTAVPISAIRQDGSTGLSVGEVFSVAALRELALVTSSNDAAYAIGEDVGELLGDGDPTQQFVQAMNIRAEELGLSSLTFWNTTGLDLSPAQPGAVGSAKDVSFLLEYILKQYPEVVAPTQQPTARVTDEAGLYHDITNTNEILVAIPNLLASKTGYTDLAGGNLTVAFDAGYDRPIIITVLGSTYHERFEDVLALMNAVQQSFEHTP